MIATGFNSSFRFGRRPSPGGDPYAAYVVSLCRFEDNFLDEYGVTWTPSSPAPTFVTGLYGSKGIRVNPGIFQTPLTPDTFTGGYFNNTSHCIEISAKVSSTWSADGRARGCVGTWQSGASGYGIRHYQGGAGNGGRFSMMVDNTVVVHPTDLTKGVKYDLALVRNGNVFTLYVDGVPSSTITSSINFVFSQLGIGLPPGGSDGSVGPFAGDLDEFRITYGVPRHTSAYIPSLPFPSP